MSTPGRGRDLPRGVLIIGNHPPPPGGVPTHIAYLAPALVEAGFDVHILSGGDTGVETHGRVVIHKFPRRARRLSLLAAPLRNALICRSHLASVATRSPRQLYSYLSSIALGRRIVEQHRIVAISAYNVMSHGPIGAILSEEFGIPLIVSSFGELFKHRNFFDAHARLVDFTLRQAVRRLSMTEHCAAVYRERAADLPYEVVHYGVDLDAFNPSRDGRRVRAELGIRNDVPLVLYLARLTREMGLEVFAAAVRLMLARRRDVKFLIGGKPEELFGFAQQLEAEHPGSIFVRGNVSSEELPEWYGASSIVVVPSLDARACGSLSAAEGSATGRPVVASRVGGVSEFVVDDATGCLVPPGDPVALSEALLRLCASPDRVKAMGYAARRFAEERLDKRRTNARICEIVSEVVESGAKVANARLYRSGRL